MLSAGNRRSNYDEKNLITPFAAAGMINTEHQVFPTFDGLMGTCKCWGSADANVGLPRLIERQCEEQFHGLAVIQWDKGQIFWADMSDVDIPRGECFVAKTDIYCHTVLSRENFV